MSVLFDPDALTFAVVEYLKISEHIYDPVATKPERDGQYRVVCLTQHIADAACIRDLLRAIVSRLEIASALATNGTPTLSTHWYSICVAEPEPIPGEPLTLIPSDP